MCVCAGALVVSPALLRFEALVGGVYARGEENGTPHAGLPGHVVPKKRGGERGLRGRRFQGRCAPHNGSMFCNSSFLIASLNCNRFKRFKSLFQIMNTRAFAIIEPFAIWG